MGSGYLFMKKTDSLDITKDNKVSNVKPVSAVLENEGNKSATTTPLEETDLSDSKVEKY